MKTTGFCTVNVDYGDKGEIYLRVSSPLVGEVDVEMSPDELMIFLVDVSNGLATGRLRELEEQIKRDLEREQRR